MGGSERYVSNISKGQSDLYDVHVYTTTHYRQRAGISEVGGVTYHRIYAPLVVWNINPVAFMLPAFLNAKSDILHIHSHLYFSSNQAVLSSKMSGTKTLMHLHGGIGSPPAGASLLRRYLKRLYDDSLGRYSIVESDHVASVSQVDLELAARRYRILPNRLHYIPNTVDISRFTPKPRRSASEPTCVLYVGDLEYWKGIDRMISWIRRLAKEGGPEFVFRFVGQGKYRESLLELKKECEVQKVSVRIEVLGELEHSEIPIQMQHADALVLPSRWEGVPTVVLEAMACGLPSIATPVGDVSRIVKDSVSGLIIDGSFASFRRALRTISDGTTTVELIRRNGRSIVEKEFSLEKVLRLLDELYARMLS